MKKSTGKMFIRSFLKSFLMIISITVIGVFSYQLVMHFWSIPENEVTQTITIKEQEKIITEASVDDISRNLIFCVDDDSGEIDKILLEIFHCKNKKLYYITIPVRTQFTMSDFLYRKLVPVNPTIPQLIKLSGLTKYFEQDILYDYGVLLIEDLLNIKISYYTVIPESLYEMMFLTEQLEAKEKNNSVENFPKEVFSKEYLAYLKKLDTIEKISNYIEEIYPSLRSNLTLSQKLNYLESYSKTPLSNVFFFVINGENQNSSYMINREQAKQQLADCMR